MARRVAYIATAAAIAGVSAGAAGAFIWHDRPASSADATDASLAAYPDSPATAPAPPQHAAASDTGTTKTNSASAAPLRLDTSLGPADDAAAEPAAPARSTRDLAADMAAQSLRVPERGPDGQFILPEELNLRVPDDTSTAELVTQGFRQDAANASEADLSSDPEIAFDLAAPDRPTPQVESYNLFNPEYGLRGFMKQGWISQNVGVQGGLGLNDDRRVETEEGFRDDIAVGMGVILAF